MPLAPGDRLGPYDILAPLGAGGMGEVYRARDTKLKRDVALKILPEHFTSDPDRLARFQREAEVLASLNHSNIAHIHGLEDAGATRALVMELVEGEDLAQRIARGPLPLDEALPIARQIAEALEAAHERGIIHRDLKPANIKVRADGTVKVLDFGLAKALERGAASQGAATVGASALLANSPTITSPALTLQGMLLGTTAYMSPEQVKGREADRRSDIWAFGCVLFEMLTGRRAFEGDDVSDTLAVVLKGEPDWRALAAVPPALDVLIKRCLERDPRRRVAGTAALRFVLDDPTALAAPPAGSPMQQAERQAAIDRIVAQSRSRLARTRVLALVAVGLIVAVAGLVLWQRPPAGERQVTRFTLGLGDSMVAALGPLAVAISPDGTHLAYMATGGRLFLRRFSDFDAQLLVVDSKTGSLGGSNPVFAPDGQAIAYFEVSERAVRRIGLSGGASVRICTGVNVPTGMTWAAGGILVGQGSQGIVRCAVAGANPEVIARVGEGEAAFGPQLLPDGKTLLFTVAKSADGVERWDRAAIVAQALPSGERKTLISGGSDARWLPTGHLIYALGGSLLVVPFDPDRLEVTGEPVPVLEGVRRALLNTGVAHFSFSATGTLAYVPGPVNPSASGFLLATADRNGAVTQLPAPQRPYSHVRASPDGRRLAIGSDDGGSEAIVFIHRLDAQTPPQRLTLQGANRYPIWSPDGLRVAFQSDRGGPRSVYIQRVDGSEVAQRLTTAAANDEHIPESWSPDGAHLSIAIRRATSYELAIVATRDGTVEPFGGVTSQEPIGSAFSPDGRWLTYGSAPPGAGPQGSDRGIFVQPFPATGQIFQAPRQALDFHPTWSRDGKELIWVPSAASGRMAIAALTTRPGIAFGTVTLVPQRVTGDKPSGVFRAWDVLPDGRFVGVVLATDAAVSRATASDLRIVLNWFEELRTVVKNRR